VLREGAGQIQRDLSQRAMVRDIVEKGWVPGSLRMRVTRPGPAGSSDTPLSLEKEG